MTPRTVNYSRLGSIAAGLFVASLTMKVSSAVGALPSFAASFIGLGDVARLGFSLAGFVGGIGVYIYTAKQMDAWPANKDSKAFKIAKLQREPDPSETVVLALTNVKDELAFCAQKEQREQILDDGKSTLAFLYQKSVEAKNVLSKTQSQQAQPPQQQEQAPEQDPEPWFWNRWIDRKP